MHSGLKGLSKSYLDLTPNPCNQLTWKYVETKGENSYHNLGVEGFEMLSAPKSNDPLHPKISRFLKQEATLYGWNSSSSQIAETFRVEILNQET